METFPCKSAHFLPPNEFDNALFSSYKKINLI